MKKQNKFNARKVEYQGMVFDSKKEFERYLYLLSCGYTNIKTQVEFELIPKSDYFRAVKYKADFVYSPSPGNIIAEDVKGYRKGAAYQVFKIKQKLMYHVYGIVVEEI
ncbi:MAG: DUF1064 domain-containing protein [Candidatus Paceibacterota bacterium]|jgi:hypothetical protein